MSELSKGAPAPLFTLPLLGGGQGEVPARGKEPLSVLLFVKKECPVCRMALPFFGRLAAAYGDRVSFQVITENASEEEGREVARLGNLPEETVHLESPPYPASSAYGLRSVPSLFVLSPEGKVEESIIGWNRAGYEALNDRLARETARTPAALITEADGAVPAMRPG